MSAVQMPRLDTSLVGRRTAAAMEAAEARAWADMYAAAPAKWAETVGMGWREFDGTLVLHWAQPRRRYFSRTIGLGVARPATGEQIDWILTIWRELGIDMFLVQSLPLCQPQRYEDWLRERGLEPFDAQDRVVRGASPLSPAAAGNGDPELLVERVNAESAEEWSEFIQRVYRLDTGPWLPRLIGRPCWHQYVARKAGAIVAARGMYLGPDGIAWLGMDGPVPGITTGDYAPDATLCAHIVAEGLERGAKRFIADIEAPSADMDTPAYEYFARLGFGRPYVRTHHTRRS